MRCIPLCHLAHHLEANVFTFVQYFILAKYFHSCYLWTHQSPKVPRRFSVAPLLPLTKLNLGLIKGTSHFFQLKQNMCCVGPAKDDPASPISVDIVLV